MIRWPGTRRDFLLAGAAATVLGPTPLAAAQATSAGSPTYTVTFAPYNAAGDGVTNDTAAIQSAINDAHAAGGGQVFFPPGTYLVTSLNLLPCVRLEGALSTDQHSALGALIQGTTGMDVLVLTPFGTLHADYQVNNLTFNGGRSHLYANGQNWSLVRVSHCVFRNAEIAALYWASGSVDNLYVESCFAASCSYGIFRIDNVPVAGFNYVDKSVFRDCYIKQSWVNGARMTCINTDEVTFDNCQVLLSGEHGIYLDGQHRSMLFTNLTTEGNGLNGKNTRTTGSIVAGQNTLTVASAAGFTAGDPIVVAGAGSDGVDLFAAVTGVSGNAITLSAPASAGVTGAPVTNGSFDDVYTAGVSANAVSLAFLGGTIGNEGSGGHLRYAINAFGASAVVLVGPIGSQNGVPCYDPYFTTQNFGSPMPVRQPATLDRDNLNRAYVAGLSGTSGGIANLERRSLVPTPAGGDLVLALRNAADDPTQTGLAYGSVHVRRQDPDRTSVLQIPAEGPIVPRGSIALLQHGDTITDATFEATPPDGTIAVGFDGSAWRLYVRIQGQWKTAPLGGAQWGSGSVTWPGGSSTSALATVTHGLGATPSAILVTFGAATVNAVIGQWFRPTAESFSVQGVAALTQPSRGTTEAFSWYAAIA